VLLMLSLLNVTCIRAQIDAAGVSGTVTSNNKLHLCGNGITVPPHSTMVRITTCSIYIAYVSAVTSCWFAQTFATILRHHHCCYVNKLMRLASITCTLAVYRSALTATELCSTCCAIVLTTSIMYRH
jgi:hypothetical protein